MEESVKKLKAEKGNYWPIENIEEGLLTKSFNSRSQKSFKARSQKFWVRKNSVYFESGEKLRLVSNKRLYL